MPLKNHIADPSTGLIAEVVDGEEQNALVVATRPLKTYVNKTLVFSNPNYGIDMNQDASTGGTPLRVHDGEDTTLWTASSIAGVKFNFSSTDQAQSGITSVEVNNPAINDVMQFSKGSDMDTSNYVAISMWIYVDKDWAPSDVINIYGWDSDTSSQVGNKVGLQNYFSWGEFGVWHKLVIPLTAMNLAVSTILDALRVEIDVKDDKTPVFYIDNLQFEETGTPIIFTVGPNKKTWLYIHKYQILFADAHAGTILNGTMPDLSYNKILSMSSLPVGIVYHSITKGQILFAGNIQNLADLMLFPSATITGQGSDGTNSWASVTIELQTPTILKAEDGDYLSITLSDDVSQLLHFRVSVGCKEENRENIN